jgi:hypothetical protein
MNLEVDTMTARDFNRAFKLAETHPELSKAERDEAFNTLLGFALGRKFATILQIAYVINYQTVMMNGARDMAELVETRLALIRNVTLLG